MACLMQAGAARRALLPPELGASLLGGFGSWGLGFRV